MKKSVLASMKRALLQLRNSATMDELSFNHGSATGFIDGAFANNDQIMIAEWDRMAKLADNAWRYRLKELQA